MANANDRQVAGQHYKGSVQHWDFAVEKFGRGYLKGQVTKYVCRWRKKNGVQDLDKAIHFMEKLIEVSNAQHAAMNVVQRVCAWLAVRLLRVACPPLTDTFLHYVVANRLSPREHLIHVKVMEDTPTAREMALHSLRKLREGALLAASSDADATPAYVNQDRGASHADYD